MRKGNRNGNETKIWIETGDDRKRMSGVELKQALHVIELCMYLDE